MSTVRTFVGIPLADATAETLVDACARVRDADASWRGEKWVAPENLHVTLRFIGGVPAAELEALTDTIANEAVHECVEFSLTLAGLRAVPSARRARMLWAAFLDPSGQCAALATAMERATLRFGGDADERAFTPHVTLVRARTPHALSESGFAGAEDAFSRAPEKMSVARVTLYSSTLTSKGPVYTELRSYPLGHD